MGTFVIGNIGNDRKGTIIISEATNNASQQCVPEPASQVPISVVSDIFDENVGFTSA
jgi:hypothetical protein